MEQIKLFLLASFSVLLISISTEIQAIPVLKFKSNGRFKIAQFSDIHFQYDSYRSDSALTIIKRVVNIEKPDMIIITGDVVCSKNTKQAWMDLAGFLTELNVPWAITLGNHDPESELSAREIIGIVSGMPNCLTVNGPDNISGNGNYILEIESHDSDKISALLYCLDSQRGFHPKNDLGSYEWIRFDQIGWYREQSAVYTKTNNGKPLPALAFFHIPLPEYKELNDSTNFVGIKNEDICSPDINSGLFSSMLECGDVIGVFTGHDHNNNFIGCLHNVCLAYGNVTGRQCYGKIGRGARIIELYEGQRMFDTWILKLYDCDRDIDTWIPVKNCEPEFKVTYPDSFRLSY